MSDLDGDLALRAYPGSRRVLPYLEHRRAQIYAGV